MTAQTKAQAWQANSDLIWIKGWLILFVIILVFDIIQMTLALLFFFRINLEKSSEGFCALCGLQTILQSGMLAFAVYSATRFFGKKLNAPATLIAFMITNIVVSSTLCFIDYRISSSAFGIIFSDRIFFAVVWAGIWIAYFKKSQRVKVTFTRT